MNNREPIHRGASATIDMVSEEPEVHDRQMSLSTITKPHNLNQEDTYFPGVSLTEKKADSINNFDRIRARNKSINVLNGFESLPSFKAKAVVDMVNNRIPSVDKNFKTSIQNKR